MQRDETSYQVLFLHCAPVEEREGHYQRNAHTKLTVFGYNITSCADIFLFICTNLVLKQMAFTQI